MEILRFILVALLFTPIFASAQNCTSVRYTQPLFANVTTTSAIKFGAADPYGLIDNQDLFLDVYEPGGDTLPKRPVIVYAYGGGFLIGTRNQPPIPYYADFFARHGYVFVAIEYRLGFSVTTPGSPERAVYRSVQDLRAAIRHLGQNAAQYRIDTSKIILMGSSAGCFAGFHSTYMEYAQAAAFATPIPVLDPEVLGGVDSVGNSDLGYKYVAPFAIINQWGALADTAWIDADERFPVISFHGDQDNAVPYVYGYPFSYPVFPNVYGSKPIHERLTNLGIPNQLKTLVGYGHEPELLDLSLRDTILQYSRDFLYPLLKPVTQISGPLQVCTQTSAVYSTASNPGSRYCWSINGNGTIVQNTGNSITVVWNDTGTVSVSVKELNYLDVEGEEQTITTQVKPLLNALFGYQANELEVEVVSFSDNAETYTWVFGDGTIASGVNYTQTYTTPGTYTISLVADNGVCPDTFRTTVTVDICPQAVFTFAYGSSQSVVFNAQPTSTLAYQWDFGDGQTLSTNTPNVLHIYQQPGTYQVILYTVNSTGCTDSDTAIVSFVTGVHQAATPPVITVQQQHIILQATDALPYTLELFTVQGQLTHQIAGEGISNISTASLPKGVYLLRLTTQQQQWVKKVVIE